MDRTNITEDSQDVLESSDNLNMELPEAKEDRIEVLFDLFKQKNLVELTKYIKVFKDNQCDILAIAHAKLNADYDKIYNKLRLSPDLDHIKHVKSFTKPNSVVMSGTGSMKAVSCKIFKMNLFSPEFQEKVYNLFNMAMPEETVNDTNESFDNPSQDYPEHCQSRTASTLKICSPCRFKSRDQVEFETHTSTHPKCPLCGLIFHNEDAFNIHYKSFHSRIPCQKCGKSILESNMEIHVRGHDTEKEYCSLISKGKVKALKKSSTKESEKKQAKVTGYRFFMQLKRPEIRSKNPDASPQEIVKLINEAWNEEKLHGRKDYWQLMADKEVSSRISGDTNIPNQEQQSSSLSSTDNHQIKACHVCGLMVGNYNLHMETSHPVSQEVIVNVVEAENSLQDVNEQQIILNPDMNDKSMNNTSEVEDLPSDDETTVQNLVSYKAGDIVMIKRKTLNWPGRVTSVNGDIYTIFMYDRDTNEEVSISSISAFDLSLPSKGKSLPWRKAWMAAKCEFEKKE